MPFNKKLKHITIPSYVSENGCKFIELSLSYQVFGCTIGTAPIVLVNHALTGNSNVSGKSGWWNKLIGNEKVIDTKLYTVLAFNIPGNGYDGACIDDYKSLIAKDIAKLFLIGLEKLNVNKLFAIIGGSLGGGIAWEMCCIKNSITKHLIPIAADWKSTDWIIANCFIQEQLLNNSNNPVHDARMHAMLCYRTPTSFKSKFDRSKNQHDALFNIESWLLHHGQKIQKRLQLTSYKLMNHILKTIDISKGSDNPYEILQKINAEILVVNINSDLFFSARENIKTVSQLRKYKNNITYQEIKSIHGHDSFLIEYAQLEKILNPIFKKNTTKKLLVNFNYSTTKI